MKKILALILSLAMLLTIVGCAQSAAPAQETAETTVTTEESSTEETTTPEEAAAEHSSTAALGANPELVPEYSRPETDAFYDDCAALAASTDADEAIALYDELLEQSLNMDTMYYIADIMYSLDVTDEYWSDELLWSASESGSMYDALCAACSEVLAGPCGEDFRAYLGDAAADALTGYEQMDDQLQQLYDRESELINEYYAQYDAVYDLAVEYDGQEWTLDELYYGEAGDELYDNDYDAYVAVNDALDAAINEVLGPIYVELVQLRQQIAALCGYDSYSDYAYECIYGRDYSPDDAAAFCAVAKEIGKRYYEQAYYDSYSAYYDFATLTADEMLAALGDHAEQIDSIVAEAWQYMMDNHLYALPDSENNDSCDQGGYTSTFPSTQTPFIYDYLYLNGESDYDFYGLSHEFGHFVDGYVNVAPSPLTSAYNYDLCEIHSNGLEVLYSAFYDDVFGEDAEAARYGVVEDQLYMVIDGALYDEFQRRVYAQEDITLEDVNRIYSEVCAEYCGEDAEVRECYWMYVHHNYDYPLYYLSYAVSSLGALQIWQLSCEDYDAAVDMWLAVLNETAYDKGTEQVMGVCGMASLNDTEEIYAVCNAALEYLIGLNG